MLASTGRPEDTEAAKRWYEAAARPAAHQAWRAIIGCLQPTLPAARMAAAMKNAAHDRSLPVNEVEDTKGKSVQEGAT